MNSSVTLAVSIACPSRRLAEFVANPMNLPRWATAFCQSVRQVGDVWRVQTEQGEMGFRFQASLEHGVLDHIVSVSPELDVYVPMRVVPNGYGSEVLLTLFRPADVDEAQFQTDLRMVQADLNQLKAIMESASGF